MDKLYKPILLAEVKARMDAELSEFTPFKVPKENPLRKWFTSSILYQKQLPSQKCVWIDWTPSEGMERAFFVLLGWSPHPDALPYFAGPKDIAYHSITGPSRGFETACINIQKLEGRAAIADFRIANPWDQVLELGPLPPEADLKAAMAKAHLEYLALTSVEREQAVKSAVDEAMGVLTSVLPEVTRRLNEL